jgi:hypothetical protein
MGFSSKQVRALQRGVPTRNIRIRKLNERELAYIEGWHAIAEANRIFGFDAWDRETVEQRCIAARETRGSTLAIYAARVRLTVRADGTTIVREGSGTGEARSNAPGQAHEVALKAAETDATKRALTTFGKPFGLALYLNGRSRTAPGHSGERQGGQTTTKAPSRPDPTKTDHEGSGDRVTDDHVAVMQQHPNATSRLPAQTASEAPPGSVPAAADTSTLSAGAGLPSTAPPRPVDKSLLMFGEPRRERDKDHLRFVAAQPCLLCSRVPSDAHHLRCAQPRAIGRKVGDQFTVPLCRIHHRQVHECSDESAWWTDLEIDAIEIAKGLWEESRAKRAALVRSLPGAIDPIGNGKI